MARAALAGLAIGVDSENCRGAGNEAGIKSGVARCGQNARAPLCGDGVSRGASANLYVARRAT